MRFGHIEIFCRDTQQSKLFYQDFGFQLTSEQHGGEIVWLELQSQSILLRPAKATQVEFKAYNEMPIALVFYTEDLKKTLKELQAKGLEAQGSDGSSLCPTFKDPDGNWIQLVNPEQH